MLLEILSFMYAYAQNLDRGVHSLFKNNGGKSTTIDRSTRIFVIFCVTEDQISKKNPNSFLSFQ